MTDHNAALVSWCLGAALGRFDPRVVNSERPLPPEPGPFDPLPSRSPGMYPRNERAIDSVDVLMDDDGHPDDLWLQPQKAEVVCSGNALPGKASSRFERRQLVENAKKIDTCPIRKRGTRNAKKFRDRTDEHIFIRNSRSTEGFQRGRLVDRSGHTKKYAHALRSMQ